MRCVKHVKARADFAENGLRPMIPFHTNASVEN